jgi:hypothetical protein
MLGVGKNRTEVNRGLHLIISSPTDVCEGI